MNIADNFHAESRMYDTVWIHNYKPLWIVKYENEHTNKIHFFKIFQVKEYELPLKKDKRLWAHDNELIGNKDGYATFEETMKAAV